MGGLYHGLQFAVTAVAGLAVGYWLDGRVLPSPLGMLGGFFAGAAVGMYILARELKKK
ncbi:MAG: AtpZ/AtpI family protein [Elusimicrobia bacterium]|nr:AtpZ/AtpI family protein [Elusimicrobiota bacterium]